MRLTMMLAALITLCATSVHADEAPAERFHPYGDFRFRAELTDFPQAPNRFRPRVRLRVGAVLDLGSGLHLGARVITGDPTDPRSAHQTLGEGGEGFTLSLDRVFIEWRPTKVKGLRLVGGKFPNAIERPAVVQGLVTDNDVQPTGVLGQLKSRGPVSFDVSLGHYIMDEKPEGEDTVATVGQVGLRMGSARKVQLRLFADAFIMDIGDSTTVDRLGHPTGRGNRVQDMRFVSDFHVVQLFAELETRAAGQPLVFSAGGMRNLRAYEHKDDLGWFVGAMIGKIDGWGTGRAYLQVQQVEQEAVFTPWAQDELPDDRGSRFRGVLGGTVLGLTSNMTVHTWVLASTLLSPGPSESSSWYGRFRLDLNVRF